MELNDETLNKQLKKKITNKINGYKIIDERIKNKFPDENINLKTITTKEAFKFIQEQNITKCPICNDELLYFNYTPFCLYQFSFDRINNKQIHHINNIQITCYNCNAQKANNEINNNNRYEVWGYCCKNNCVKECHYTDDIKNEEIRKKCPEELIKVGGRHKKIKIKLI